MYQRIMGIMLRLEYIIRHLELFITMPRFVIVISAHLTTEGIEDITKDTATSIVDGMTMDIVAAIIAGKVKAFKLA
jgi:hypothetical protein